IPRDRIRTVDVTAGLVHRLFRLSVLKIGTGERADGVESRELTLDAIATSEADQVRPRLLDPSAGSRERETVARAVEELAALRWSWLRFAPLTVSSLVALGAVGGAFAQLVNDVGAETVGVGKVGKRLTTAPLWLGVTVLTSLILLVALVGSVLRGIEVVESPLLRAGRGARTVAVATGLGGRRSHGRGTLLPPAPRSEAHRVSGLVLGKTPSPTNTPLRRHPRAALRRRLVRGTLPVMATAGALWFAPAPAWATWVALGLLPVTVLLAGDAYRNLGHTLTGRYL